MFKKDKKPETFLNNDNMNNKDALSFFADKTPVAVMIHHGDKLLYVNKAAVQITGYLNDELLLMKFTDIVHPDFKELVMEKDKTILRKNSPPQIYDIKIISKNGTPKWLFANSSVFNYEGESAVMIIAIDITDRRRVEDTLLRSELNLNSVIKASPDIIYRLDNNKIITFINDAVRKYGYTPEDLIGKHIIEFVHPEDRSSANYSINERRTGKRSTMSLEVRLFNNLSNSNTGPASTESNKIFLIAAEGLYKSEKPRADTFIGTQGIARDITERKKEEDEIKKRKEYLEAIMDSSLDMIITLKENGTFGFLSKRATDLYGSVYDRNFIEFIPDDFKPFILEKWEEARRGVDSIFETQVLAPDGSRLNAIISHSKLKYPNEFLVILKDITELKQTEEKLVESEERYKALFERSLDAVYIHDFDGNFIDVNSSTIDLLGYTKNELLSLNFRQIIKDDAEKFLSTLRDIIKFGTQKELIKIQLVKKDGGHIWVEAKSSLIFRNGTPYAIQGIARNITERINSEEALQESEKRFRSVVENSNNGIVIIDESYKLIYINDEIRNIFGYTNEELLNNDFRTFLDSENFRFFDDRYNRRLKGESVSVRYEAVIRRKNGDKRRLEINTAVINDSKNKHQTVVNLKDVTEQKKLEEQLFQSRKMESIGRLAGGVAHDFNNMLMPIMGYTEMLLHEFPGDTSQHYDLQQIREAALRARDLTQNLLAFSRKQVFEIKVTSIGETIKNFEKILRRTIREDIQLEITDKSDSSLIRTDPSQIEQILLNLAINSQNAMPEGGKLTITVSNVYFSQESIINDQVAVAGNYIEITITDTGSGMDSDTLKQIFEPFFSTQEMGKGLGLAMVYGIVDQLSGYIQVSSEPGKGSTFKIYFPRYEEILDKLKKNVEQEDIFQDGTILIVEDEKTVRELTTRILDRKGYRILEAGSGEEALILSEKYKDTIDLLLTDVVLPKMNGRELYDILALTRKNMKVLYMSGYTDEVISRYGVFEKNKNYIQKPVTIQSLTEKVHEIINT